ncbi:MAG TPA: ABC transporter substrate-binding protein [Candidatus Pelethocola excrementipullorum]|nr:ABC transporter substrate-binding protein [Candidatus Pelethocola excrementipullorum]
MLAERKGGRPLRGRSRILAAVLSTVLSISMLYGCGSGKDGGSASSNTGEKVFNYGTTAYGVAMENVGLDPHDTYSGWSTLRYGVGETLFKFNEKMELEPWLATDYEQVDEYTLKIHLRDDVNFTSGNKMTGEAVKACLEDLITRHDRAPEDLKIESITAEGQSVIIKSKEKVPALIHYLCDPYGAIIDMEAGVSEDKNVSGTGPYIAENVTDTEINLVANKNYWGGTPKVDRVNVKSITDGDTLTMAMQNGEIDAAQGLPYVSLKLFQNNESFSISSCDTSRVYQAAINFKTPVLQDEKVREAIAMGIDKEGFTTVLLDGNGTAATGPFPANFTFGKDAVSAPAYDPQGARELLSQAGWKDTDGDGYVDKDGKPLEIRWLTYTSRQELPLLAESVQATLKAIGIKVIVNATDNYNEYLKKGEFDIYAKAIVTAPTGDPQYYFTTHLLDSSSYNSGNYHSDKVEELTEQLRNEYDMEKRSQLAIQIEQQILDDHAFIYASHLKMSFVMKKGIGGFEAHPSDYYEITADLDIIQ